MEIFIVFETGGLPSEQKWLIQIYQCQKLTQFFFKLFSCNNIELEGQHLVLTFCDNFNFFNHFKCENKPNFFQLCIPPFQKTLKFL